MHRSTGRFPGRIPPTHGRRRPPRRAGAARSAIARAGLCFLGLLAGCSRKEQPAPPPPAPVQIDVAETRSVPISLRGIGTVEASSTVSVRARVSGQITRVHFKEGQDVAEGDLLFSIDPRPFEAALRQAEANLRKDEVQAANAEVEARRYEALVAEGVASREDAQARRANAAALAAVVQADRAAVASSKLELGYTTVRAPMDGRTGSVRAREGSVIQADTTELVVINKIRPAFVGFTVPEQSLGEIQRYMAAGPLPIAAAPPNVQGPPEQGVLTFVDNAVDRATGTILLRGTFANESLRLWPGQFVQATVVLTRMPDAVVVPGAAIQSSQSGTYVFVIQPDLTAQMRPVEVGTQVDGGAVVVARGLSAGERVVTDGQLRLVPGAKVAIQERPAGPEDAGAEGGP